MRTIPALPTRGRYTKQLPDRLGKAYHESLADPQLSGMQDELALCDSRIQELMDELKQTGSPRGTWNAALHLARRIAASANPKVKGDDPTLIDNLVELLEAGKSADRVWDLMFQSMEQRRRISETENKRIVAMSQAVPIRKVVEVVTLLCQSLKQHVVNHAPTDVADRILSGAARDVRSIIAAHNLQPVGPSAFEDDPSTGEDDHLA